MKKMTLHSSCLSMPVAGDRVYPGHLCGCLPDENCVGAPGKMELCVKGTLFSFMSKKKLKYLRNCVSIGGDSLCEV